MEREEEEERETHTQHTNSGVAVGLSGVQSVEGFSPYLKTSSLGRKISPGLLFIDEESHTHNVQIHSKHTHTLSLHFTKPTGKHPSPTENHVKMFFKCVANNP